MGIVRGSLFASLLFVSACGLPINQMSSDERKADLKWAFSLFRANYAPLELKKANYGLELDELESSCLELAEEDQDNQAFLALYQKCLHSFKDAHVGAQQMNNGILPEYAQVAHLGFLTFRTKAIFNAEEVNALRVVSLLKGTEGTDSPILAGDLILSVNKKSVGLYLKDEIIPYIHTGQDETNLTQAAFRFGIRTSTDMSLPSEDNIKLLVQRDSAVFEIELPWVKEDLLAFQLKQNPPKEEDPGQANPPLPNPENPQLSNPLAESFFGYEELKQVVHFLETPAFNVTERLKSMAETGFRWAKFNPVLDSLFNGELDKEGAIDSLIKKRQFPMAAKVEELMSEPGINAKMVTTEEGNTYAYIQLGSFPAEDKVLEEWARAINAIEDKEIKSVIIDLIDNGGGSLVHGMRMVNGLRKKTMDLPTMQFRLNNNWMNAFKTQAAFGESDYLKTIAAQVVKKLEEDKKAGKALSRPISVDVLDPFELQKTEQGLSDDVRVALLVNELCVSMCDLFASVFQDNKMGIVIGQRTVGGGGNVAQHGLSPIAKIGVALTESLLISPSGKYLEDQGVTPDVELDMVAGREGGFAEAFSKAYQAIFPGPAN